MYDKAVTTGLAALQQAAKMLAGARTGADSLVGYTSPARVEPLLVIDDKLMFSDAIFDVNQSLLNQFTGYYLQAAALAGQVGNINVVDRLDSLNPNRNGQQTLAGHVLSAVGIESHKPGQKFGMESYYDFTDRLPVPGDVRNTEQQKIAMESTSARDIAGEMRQLSNMSVGKQVNVEITDGKNKAIIPVNIRLLANSIDTGGIIHILTGGSKDYTFRERLQQLKSGEIEFWRDFIGATDLIDQYKKHQMNDQSGLLGQFIRRRNNNTLAGLVSGEFSIATASNIIVISESTAVEAQIALGGRLSDYKVRKAIFDKTYLMILAVVDTDRDRVTFYYRGIPESTSLSMRDLKAANKGSGPDISDILAAYRMGSAPAIG